ncbi:hypothetical protein ACVWYG_003118 [Pedobacter sp. UYEF25]
MKTSNKLLIAFGIFLFVVPLLGMVVISKVFYKDASNMNIAEIQKINNQPFQIVTEGRKAISVNEPFSAVNFPNGNNSSVELHFNKSANYGIKIPEELVGAIKLNVVNGVLNINFAKDLSISDFRNRIFIVVYAPNFHKLSAYNLFNLNCIAQTDSLFVDLDKTNFSIGESNVTEKEINKKGDIVSYKVFNHTFLKTLKLVANNSKIDITELNLNGLSIEANNNSEIYLDGSHFDKGESTIRNLAVKTVGQNQVNIKHINLEKASSDFSDSTQLNIPTPMLKLLLKD